VHGIVYYTVQGGSNFLSLWMKSWSVTIQMKVTEQYFPLVLFIMLCKVVVAFESVDKFFCVTSIQMKAIEHLFPVIQKKNWKQNKMAYGFH